MLPGAVEPIEGGFQDRDRLDRVRAFGRFAGGQIPKLPRRAVHDRLGEEAADIEIAAMGLVDRAHRVGVGVVPGREILDRGIVRIALRDRFDQGPLEDG